VTKVWLLFSHVVNRNMKVTGARRAVRICWVSRRVLNWYHSSC